MAALWLDPDRVTRIVHLGSGSGSLLACVLADTGLNFLRLLAIGYPEICWNGEFADPPRPLDHHGDTVNRPCRDWLRSTSGVTIPATALEIVHQPSEMGDTATTDPLCRWVNQLTGLFRQVMPVPLAEEYVGRGSWQVWIGMLGKV